MTSETASSQPPAMILVVDGEILVRLAISAYLRECGYNVIEAATAEEAMMVLAEPGYNIAAVLCDAALAGTMNGFALAKRIRDQKNNVKVILAVGPAQAANRAGELCEEGPHLGRPYESQLVHDRIKGLLTERDRNASS